MTTMTSKGGVRNKKLIALLEKHVYPNIREGLEEVII